MKPVRKSTSSRLKTVNLYVCTGFVSILKLIYQQLILESFFMSAHDMKAAGDAKSPQFTPLTQQTQTPGFSPLTDVQGPVSGDAPLTAHQILQLQRQIGNRATNLYLQRQAPKVQRNPGQAPQVADPDELMLGLWTEEMLVDTYERLMQTRGELISGASGDLGRIKQAVAVTSPMKDLTGITNEALQKRATTSAAQVTAPAEKARQSAEDAMETLQEQNTLSQTIEIDFVQAMGQHDKLTMYKTVKQIEAAVGEMRAARETIRKQAESVANAERDQGLIAMGLDTGKTPSWDTLRSKASDVAVKMDKRLMKAERYYTYQSADNEALLGYLEQRRQDLLNMGLSAESVNKIVAAGQGRAGSGGGTIDYAAAESLLSDQDKEAWLNTFDDKRSKLKKLFTRRSAQSEDQRQKKLKAIRYLEMFARQSVESQMRLDRSVVAYQTIQQYNQQALSLYDEIAAEIKKPEGQRGDLNSYISRVGASWVHLMDAERHRNTLKADKKTVVEESGKYNKYGERQIHSAKKLGKKIVAGAAGAALGMVTFGRYEVEAADKGAGYQAQLQKVDRSEKIRKLVNQIVSIVANQGNQGAGLGGAVGRAIYATLTAVSGIIPLLKPIFSTIGTISTIVGAILGAFTKGAAVGVFGAITTTCFAINLTLSVIKLLTDAAMFLWTAIANMAAKDPRARINTGGKWRQQALLTGMGVLDVGLQSTALVTQGLVSGNPLDALNPAATFGRAMNNGATYSMTGAIMDKAQHGLGNQALFNVPLGGKGLDVSGNLIGKVGEGVIRGGIGVGASVGKAVTPDIAYATGGDHRMKRNNSSFDTPSQEQMNDAETRQRNNTLSEDPSAQISGQESEAESRGLESADKLDDIVGQSKDGVLDKMQQGVKLGEENENVGGDSGPDKEKKKGSSAFRQAMMLVKDVLFTVLVIPGLIEDIVKGIRKGYKDYKAAKK